MIQETGNPIIPGGGLVVGSLENPILLERMGKESIRFIYSTRDGKTKSFPKRVCGVVRTNLQEHLAKHLDGDRRFGCSPVRRDGRVLWLAWDLDSHRPEDPPDRAQDALTLLSQLRGCGLTAYWARSRSGKGAHVFLFLEDPGLLKDEAEALAARIKTEFQADHPGGLDLFPKSNQAVYLPLFGGAPLLDERGASVEPEGIILTLVEKACRLVPRLSSRAASAPERGGADRPRPAKRPKPPAAYLPKLWRRDFKGPGGATDPALCFRGPDGLLHARRGGRNHLAGTAAKAILARGGTLDDFRKWDSYNKPPLAADEPEHFEGWWKWAQRKAQPKEN